MVSNVTSYGSVPHLTGSQICPFWDFVVLFHRSMLTAWVDFLCGRKTPDNGPVPIGGGLFGGGASSSSSRKQIIERDHSRVSRRSYASPSPVGDMPLTVLESQKVAGWQSPIPERRYVAPQRSFSAPRRPTFSNEDDDDKDYSHHYPSFRTYSSIASSPKSSK
ncbi:hypothetical protein DIZ76_013920 [Coccidioides immitis]|nr:hypothetical protein DIZ76_013920 [Coccidioides immitis]